MSGSIPPYAQASAIILRLCSPLFQASMRIEEADPADPYFNAWFMLRRIASIFVEQRTLVLSASDRAQLVSSLELAHALAHDAELQDAPPVEMCHCAVREDILDLAALIQAAADEAEGAAA